MGWGYETGGGASLFLKLKQFFSDLRGGTAPVRRGGLFGLADRVVLAEDTLHVASSEEDVSNSHVPGENRLFSHVHAKRSCFGEYSCPAVTSFSGQPVYTASPAA